MLGSYLWAFHLGIAPTPLPQDAGNLRNGGLSVQQRSPLWQLCSLSITPGFRQVAGPPVGVIIWQEGCGLRLIGGRELAWL